MPSVRRHALEATVWDALRQIPAGQTRSYGEIARISAAPGAARGGAGQRRQSVADHRSLPSVIGADRSLTGYGGKIWRKQWLLEHERRIATSFSKG